MGKLRAEPTLFCAAGEPSGAAGGGAARRGCVRGVRAQRMRRRIGRGSRLVRSHHWEHFLLRFGSVMMPCSVWKILGKLNVKLKLERQCRVEEHCADSAEPIRIHMHTRAAHVTNYHVNGPF